MRVRVLFSAACVGALASVIVGCSRGEQAKIPNPHYKDTDVMVFLDSDCTTVVKNDTPVGFQGHQIAWKGFSKCARPANLPAGTPDFEIRFQLENGQTVPLQCQSACTGSISPEGKLNAKFSVTGKVDLYHYTLYVYGKPYADPDLEIDP